MSTEAFAVGQPYQVEASVGYGHMQAKSTERRSAISLKITRAENGWVVSFGEQFWIAKDAEGLSVLVEALADEFQVREVTL